MPYIKKEFIQGTLIPAVDIVRLIQQYVTLKKSGKDWKCCCPFHNEKTPSFTVNQQKGTYRCYGCGAHGSAINFLMQYKNLEFVDAVEELARFAGLEVEYDNNSLNKMRRDDSSKELYEIMDRAAYFFTDQLHKNPQALDYFVKQRGLNLELIKKARLGFAPDNRDYVERQLMRSSEEYQNFVTLGLQTDRREDDGRYVRRAFFRGRVIFPIFDIKGRIVAFGGRVLGSDAIPKYLNTPETPIFKKRLELFGLYETLQANRNRPEKVVIVEGYMDAIALRQAGYNNIVATLGTSITKEHLKQLFRFTDKVICCFDGDEAGKKATWRALKAVTPVLDDPRKEVYFVNMSPGHDPDTLVREQGPQAFEAELNMAVSYSESILLHESKLYDISDPNLRARLIDSVLSIIKAMKSQTLQIVTLQVLSAYVDISLDALQNMLNSSGIKANQEFIDVEVYESSNRPNTNYQTISSKYVSKQNLPTWARNYSSGTKVKSIKVNPNYGHNREGNGVIGGAIPIAPANAQRPWGDGMMRSMSVQEFNEQLWRQHMAQNQFTPAANYMNLGPNGAPFSATYDSDEPSGEYFEGGRGPEGNLMNRANESSYGATVSVVPQVSQEAREGSNEALALRDQHYHSVVGRDFSINELESSSYRLLGFALQNPTTVANVYESFKLDSMLAYAKALRVVEYPSIERVFTFIKQHPTTSCAAILEEFRNTPFDALFNLLSELTILPNTSDNNDFDITTKTIFLGNFIFELLKEPLKWRIDELKQGAMSEDDLAEVIHLNQVLSHNFREGSLR